MTGFPTFLMLRLLIGFIIGGLMARRIQDPMRKLILNCTPMRKRLSPKYYFFQTFKPQNHVNFLVQMAKCIITLSLNFFVLVRIKLLNKSFPKQIGIYSLPEHTLHDSAKWSLPLPQRPSVLVVSPC